MTLIFIILGLIFLLLILFIILLLSVIEIEIGYLNFDSDRKENNYLVYLRLKLLKRITWAKIKLDSKGIEKYRKINNRILQKIKNKLKNESFNLKENLRKIRESRANLEKVNLEVEIGLVDAVSTSFVVGITSSIISIIIAKSLKEYDEKKCKYKILPIYNKLGIKINLSCIITVKMVHIITIVYMLFKKGSARNGKLSSNRRAYESINE